jgi:anti-sigma B factor antagonist
MKGNIIMQIDAKKENDVIVVVVEGDLDINTSPDLRDKFEELIGQGENQYVIDLAGVPFVDSSGIAALVSLFKRVRIGAGDVKLCGIQAEVLKIFELTRLNRVFQIFDSRADAVASF